MKIFFTILITALVMIFGMQNFDHVELFLLMGRPVKIRLVFIVAISFGIGFMSCYLKHISKEEELKRKCRELIRINRQLKQRLSREEI